MPGICLICRILTKQGPILFSYPVRPVTNDFIITGITYPSGNTDSSGNGFYIVNYMHDTAAGSNGWIGCSGAPLTWNPDNYN